MNTLCGEQKPYLTKKRHLPCLVASRSASLFPAGHWDSSGGQRQDYLFPKPERTSPSGLRGLQLKDAKPFTIFEGVGVVRAAQASLSL